MLYGLSIAKIVFPLLTLPYLTRVLSLECYGTVAYVKSIMQYMQLFIDFGFMLSGTKNIVSVSQDREEVGQTTGDILAARLILSAVAFAFLSLLASLLPLLREYTVFTLLSFVPVFLSVFLFDYLFRGLEKMQIITTRFVLMRSVSTVLTYLLVRSDADLIWIPILDIIGTLLAVMLVGIQIKKMEINVRFGTLKSAASKLKESIAYFLSNIATTAFGALNTIIIGIVLPASDVAYWSVSLQMIAAIMVLYHPIIDGIYPEMIKTKDPRLINRTLIFVMPTILLGSIFCFAEADLLLRLIGGLQYAGAASVFRSLIPVLILSFPTMLCGWPALGAIEKQRQVTATTVLAAILQAGGLVLAWVVGCFTLQTIALIRCLSELVLLLSRVCFCVKFKYMFATKKV